MLVLLQQTRSIHWERVHQILYRVSKVLRPSCPITKLRYKKWQWETRNFAATIML